MHQLALQTWTGMSRGQTAKLPADLPVSMQHRHGHFEPRKVCCLTLPVHALTAHTASCVSALPS